MYKMSNNFYKIIIAFVIGFVVFWIILLIKAKRKFKARTFLLNDDSCELISSFLTFKERCLLERTSQQFRALIFKHQTKLFVKGNSDEDEHLDQTRVLGNNIYLDRIIDINLFESLLKKCQYIKKLELRNVLIEDLVLEVITENCPRLKSIAFDVNNASEEGIRMIGQRMGLNLESITFLDESVSGIESNRQLLLSFCPNLKTLRCNKLSSVHIESEVLLPKLERLFIEYKEWPNIEISAMTEIINKYSEGTLSSIYLGNKWPDFDFETAVQQLIRLTNLRDIELSVALDYNTENQDENFIFYTLLENIGSHCKNMRKVRFSQRNYGAINMSFNMWNTFKDYKVLEKLMFSETICHFEDLISPIIPLTKLRTITIDCKSIGDQFFLDISQFAPNLQVLDVQCNQPKYNISNQSLIALSECKHLKKLKLDINGNYIYSNYCPRNDDPLNEIGVIHLLYNCQKLINIQLPYMINSFVEICKKWFEMNNNLPKKEITFECYLSDEHFSTVLLELSLLPQLKHFVYRLKNDFEDYWRFDLDNKIIVNCNKLTEISIQLAERTRLQESFDFWALFGPFSQMTILEFNLEYVYILDSLDKNISITHLKEIAIICQSIGTHFYENIAEFAPNLEIFRIRCRFKLKNHTLRPFERLKQLSVIKFGINCSNKRTGHKFGDSGVKNLLDNCLKLRDMYFEIEIDITLKTIQRLEKIANNRPKDMIRFECFVNKPELESKRFKNLANNLIIKTNLYEKPKIED